MIFRVSSHTDHIGAGSTYVVINGTNHNGADFVEQALARGATKIVIQKDQPLTPALVNVCKKKNVTVHEVIDTRSALAELSAQAYDHPAKKLKILAVTGTDGKTTSTYLLYHILKAADKKVALLSGVQNIINDHIIKADLTTAKPDFLHYFFHECVQADIEYVAMEVSAQAASLHRIDGLEFSGCIFTNLAHEHGECYENFDDYFAAKCAIIQHKKDSTPLIAHAGSWTEKLKKIFPETRTCGFTAENNYQVVCLQETLNHQSLEINIGGKRYQFDSPLIGDYNALNITGAVALAHALEINPEIMNIAIHAFSGAQGRLERHLLPNGSLAIVDYAHTPQAYTALLSRLKKYARRLIVIFGAGGGKDVQKRPVMGKIATHYGDLVILTNDNPRHEDPHIIMEQIMADLSIDERARVRCEQDRAHAINMAYEQTGTGDIIAILGKGGETVQIVGTQRIPHSDEQVVRSLGT